MKKTTPILNFIFGLANIRTLYEDIKRNEEAKQVSTVLGKKALGYCFWFVAFVAMAIGLGMWGAKYVNTIAFLFGIIVVILAVVMAIYSVSFLLFALSCSLKQIRLNRKPIGVIALIVTLLLVVAVAVVASIVFSKIK